jgi:hypothetical protein
MTNSPEPTNASSPSQPHFTNAVLIKDLSWFTHHIILLAIAAGLVFGAVYFVENLISKHDVANAAVTAKILATQEEQTKAIQTQLTTDESHWTQIEQTLLAQNAQLTKTIENEHVQIEKQRTVDATLTAQEAATRLAQQTQAKSGEVVAQGDNIVLDLPITRSIVSDLDLLVGTQAELQNTQTQLKNETTIAGNDQTNINEQAALITSLKTQNADQIKSCSAQIAVVKAKDRKSKIKWFFSGVIVGFIGKRLALGSW